VNNTEIKTATVKFRLNGISLTKGIPVDWTLLRFLRDGLGLYGTKCGCEIGECGVCTVLVDGQAVNACLILGPQIEGANIWTIEGIAPDGRSLHPLQSIFVECDAVHCGFCSPGMVLSAIALLLHNPKPSDEEIRIALAGNLCRCTGYVQIVEAVQKTAAANINLDKFRK
jgi:aerobic carbon-monoxide dehydrogenase small subunit